MQQKVHGKCSSGSSRTDRKCSSAGDGGRKVHGKCSRKSMESAAVVHQGRIESAAVRTKVHGKCSRKSMESAAVVHQGRMERAAASSAGVNEN